MPYIFLAAIAVILLVVIANWAANADPVAVRKIGRYLGAILVAVGAIFMATRGQFAIAAPMAALAFMLATGVRIPGLGGGAKTRGQKSQVQTEWLNMTLDHDTGTMDGEVLHGEFEGRHLSDLDKSELSALFNHLKATDPESARLLDAYLARRFQGEWQAEDDQAGPATGDKPMSRDEALEILGLDEGAGKSDIIAAHRRLMKKFHPDQGGTTYFAARLNQAKDLLLK